MYYTKFQSNSNNWYHFHFDWITFVIVIVIIILGQKGYQFLAEKTPSKKISVLLINGMEIGKYNNSPLYRKIKIASSFIEPNKINKQDNWSFHFNTVETS